MSAFRIPSLRVGRVRPLGPQAVPSAIDKSEVQGPVHAGPLGLEGDEQGDRRHHGGPDKAIHAYASAHYPAWAAELPEAARHFRPGAFGENLVVDGATEATICLGDRWRIGTASLEVSQSRQPCWKLNLRFERPDMALRVQASGRTGWYFRVLEPGVISAGDTARLIHRPHPDWPLARILRLLYRDTLDRDALASLAALPGIPASWQRLLRRRLENAAVEDWNSRLQTPS
ncbi:MAG: MOSC domain-containing protein [Gammaproteobacteria bacterium]|nr:MOSC domain-containing protein [Gammaproteobacteria bacterium]